MPIENESLAFGGFESQTLDDEHENMGSSFHLTERQTASYTATIKDFTGAALAVANISTAQLTLALRDGTIINSRDAQDVKNTNNVTIHATSGLLTWSIQPGDTQMIDEYAVTERHVATFDIVRATTGERIIHQIVLNIRNLKAITA